MINKDQYNNLKKEFGMKSSWAIWGDDLQDIEIFDKNINQLKNNIVMVALNPAGPPDSIWKNFHYGKSDFKLRDAFNNSTYRGAYLIDILEAPDPNSGNIAKRLKNGELPSKKDIKNFNRQFELLNADVKNTIIIVFGGLAEIVFYRNFCNAYKKVIALTHYSNVMSKEKWIKQTWETLENSTSDFPIELRFKREA